MFIKLTVTRSRMTSETEAGEPVYAKAESTTAINAAHIVAVEFRPTSSGVDLIIKTADGDTWSFPGTDGNLAAIREVIEYAD
jgi:hypothetical protein